jgi:DNA-binding NtrC family response regulator
MRSNTAGKKILLVDDEPLVSSICETVLRRHNFEPIVAGNGAEGLAIYRARHEEICLVLSDVSMPEMGGLEMVRRILETHAYANVILMSGYNPEHIVPADLRGVCSVIGKPFRAAGLIEAVKKCLKYDEDRELRESA